MLPLAEVILRLACGLVGWLLLFAHGLLLAVVPEADCSPELWRTTALFAGFAVVAALLLPAALRWRASLRWLAVPAGGLWLYGLFVSAGLLSGSTLGNASLCASLVDLQDPALSSSWERAWAPLQLVAIFFAASQAARYWRGER